MARRVLLVGLKQESATFNPRPMGLEDFEVVHGGAALDALSGTATEAGGAIEAAAELGLELVAGTLAWALSGGVVDAATWHDLRDRIVAEVEAQRDVDGVLVVLHGAMVAADEDDPDGALLTAIRAAVGDRPVVATLDLHAIVTARMLAAADVLVPFHTYPHTDHHSTGRRGTAALAGLLSGVVPRTAFVRVPLLARGDELLTRSGLLGAWVDRVKALEAGPSGLAGGVLIGNPFTDVPALCSAVLVTTDAADRAVGTEAARVATDVAASMWAERERLRTHLVRVDDAVAGTAEVPGLSILADQADATSSGAPGDSVAILRRILAGSGARPAVVPVVDAPAARAAAEAGVHARRRFSLGGTISGHVPVEVDAEVVAVHEDSTFAYEDGTVGRAGTAAVLRADGVDILVTSRPVWFVGRAVYVAHGIGLDRARVVVVKSPNGFRPHWEHLAASIVSVDGDGPTTAALHRLPYARVGRPVFPLDAVDGVELEPEEWIARRLSR